MKTNNAVKVLCKFIINFIEKHKARFEYEFFYGKSGIEGYRYNDYIKDLKKNDEETLEFILSEFCIPYCKELNFQDKIIYQSGYDVETERHDFELITVFDIDGQLIQMRKFQKYLGDETHEEIEENYLGQIISKSIVSYPQYSHWETSFDFVKKTQKIITIDAYELIETR